VNYYNITAKPYLSALRSKAWQVSPMPEVQIYNKAVKEKDIKIKIEAF